ncbi:hypothetical protein Mapa_011325 [Marchantia paleacea]|nr:hypothetical protein Mapa_011325 [Marchantia paleacea]
MEVSNSSLPMCSFSDNKWHSTNRSPPRPLVLLACQPSLTRSEKICITTSVLKSTFDGSVGATRLESLAWVYLTYDEPSRSIHRFYHSTSKEGDIRRSWICTSSQNLRALPSPRWP